MIYKLLIFISTLLLFACGDGGSNNSPNQQAEQGARILGLDIKEIPTVTFDNAYNAAIAIGVREDSVALDWELLEPTVGNYVDTIPDTIDIFYPSKTGDVTLIIRPLDTLGARYPSDLVGNFDDAAVITAFDNFLTHLHGRLTTLNGSGKLKWIQVGNEIDANLGADASKWTQWKTFFDAAKNKINSLWPGVEVSSVIQFGALQNQNILTQYLTLLPSLDNAAVTYYPLEPDFTIRPTSTVATDFDLMVSAIPNKNIILQECGYPSSSVNISSEAQQADFITEVFKAWDKYSSRISLIDFTWQYDISDAEVTQLVIDFGLSGTANENEFRNYIGSIGLSNHDATEKLALQQLRDELVTRKWEQ